LFFPSTGLLILQLQKIPKIHPYPDCPIFSHQTSYSNPANGPRPWWPRNLVMICPETFGDRHSFTNQLLTARTSHTSSEALGSTFSTVMARNASSKYIYYIYTVYIYNTIDRMCNPIEIYRKNQKWPKSSNFLDSETTVPSRQIDIVTWSLKPTRPSRTPFPVM
jgi:hypothetical protein